MCFFAFRGCVGSQVELLAPGQSAEVTITEGETASSIGDALVAARLIGSSREFTDEVTRLEASSAHIPGTYNFQGGSPPEELERAIMAGPAQVGDTLAVPEDITRAELSELVASATGGRITAEAFLAASENASAYVADYAFLESAGENSLEGFLFPKTYAVTEDMDAEAVVRMMLDQFGTETASIFGDIAIDVEKCSGCGMCVMFCPTDALRKAVDRHPDEGKAYLEFQVSDCGQCNLCADACLKKCIEIVPVVSMEELFDFEPRLVEISAAKKGNKLFNRNK